MTSDLILTALAFVGLGSCLAVDFAQACCAAGAFEDQPKDRGP